MVYIIRVENIIFSCILISSRMKRTLSFPEGRTRIRNANNSFFSYVFMFFFFNMHSVFLLEILHNVRFLESATSC